MARIAGIKLHKAVNGKIKTVTFDFKKHGDIITPILEKLGAVEVDTEKERFMKKFNSGITKDELLKDIYEYIDSLSWKK